MNTITTCLDDCSAYQFIQREINNNQIDIIQYLIHNPYYLNKTPKLNYNLIKIL